MKEQNYKKPIYREWNSKIFATPKVPRGSLGMIETINLILEAVKNKVPMIFMYSIKTNRSIKTELWNMDVN